MVLQAPRATVCLSSQSLETSSCVSQLEADIPQLKEALRQRKQIGVATGLLARRPAWKPVPPIASSTGKFEFVDLLKFAGAV